MFSKFLDGLKQIVLGPPSKSGQDGRSRTRVLCRYPVLYSQEGSVEQHRAYVVDIGISGMRLEGVQKFKKGDLIRVASAYPGMEQNKLQCEVMWCRQKGNEFSAGIRYVETEENLKGSWVKVILQELGLADENAFQRRKHLRIATTLRCEIRNLRTGHYITDGRVLNLSVGGALVQSANSVDDGAQVLCLIGPYSNYPTLSISAKNLNTRYDEDEGCYLHSVQFSTLKPRDVKQVGKYVVDLLKGRSVG